MRFEAHGRPPHESRAGWRRRFRGSTPAAPSLLRHAQDLPGRLRFDVHGAIPDGYVCSASLKGTLPPTVVHEAVSGQRPISKLFSKPQRAFFAEHAPSGLGLDDLAVLGPIFVLKVKLQPKELDRRLVVDVRRKSDGGIDHGPRLPRTPGGLTVLARLPAKEPDREHEAL